VQLTYIQSSGSLQRLASLLQTWPQHVNATRQLVGLSRCFAGHCSVCTNVKACLRSVAATCISSMDENGSSCTSCQRDHQGTCLPPHSLRTPDFYPTGPSRQQHPFDHDLFNEIESSPKHYVSIASRVVDNFYLFPYSPYDLSSRRPLDLYIHTIVHCVGCVFTITFVDFSSSLSLSPS
jgi:hypothetical protein